MRSWTVRVEEDLASRIGLIAEMEGVSIQALIVGLLENRAAAAEGDEQLQELARQKVAALARSYGLEP